MEFGLRMIVYHLMDMLTLREQLVSAQGPDRSAAAVGHFDIGRKPPARQIRVGNIY
jgi:hypothetical protein